MAVLFDYDKAQRLLNRYKIRSIESRYVSSPEAAIKFADNDPIVLKALTNKALHKTKSGLVVLNLSTDKEIRNAFNALSKKAARFKPYKILAQRMVKDGIEIILGGNTDPQFGKMVLLGLGGIYVETFKDFALRTCPITRYDARSMLEQLKSRKIIAPDEKSSKMLEELLLKVSRMFAASEMKELDLNPIILHDGTYDAVDLRMLE
ncbi:MAG: acetate--CoA ligase family protein [Candidatus Micrarchaeales archaeon]|nr:acetate--CoA ligase family protein [Candidatus Micrarchaeales archaeon]